MYDDELELESDFPRNPSGWELRLPMVSNELKKSPRHRATSKRVALIILGTLLGAAFLTYVVAVLSSIASSVPITFVNDTQLTAILPDCGSYTTGIAPGRAMSVAVDRGTRYCSIDALGASRSVELVGCLKMPVPLKAYDAVRISDATSDTRRCR